MKLCDQCEENQRAMARKRWLEDLDPYTGCEQDDYLGITPLAVGFLTHKRQFETGEANLKFTTKLLRFCSAEITVCPTPQPRPCPLCNQPITVNGWRLGGAEIRTIGDEEIYAAPDLIYHYIVDHGYAPPAEFVRSVMKGPGVDSAEYRALINFYS